MMNVNLLFNIVKEPQKSIATIIWSKYIAGNKHTCSYMYQLIAGVIFRGSWSCSTITTLAVYITQVKVEAHFDISLCMYPFNKHKQYYVKYALGLGQRLSCYADCVSLFVSAILNKIRRK